MGRRRHQRQYRVHLIQAVRVGIHPVDAADANDAIEKAQAAVDWHHLFRDIRGLDTDYNEHLVAACVDVIGDENFVLSQWYEDSHANCIVSLLEEVVKARGDPERLNAAIDAAQRFLLTRLL